jgi:hypothetical protein
MQKAHGFDTSSSLLTLADKEAMAAMVEMELQMGMMEG